jgi:parvulin-like peptidyl-prolyl isomerase
MQYLQKYILYIILFFILFSGCDFFGGNTKKGTITIGKRVISEDELQKDIVRIIFEMGITDQEAKLGIRQIINKVIEKNLILEYGKEEGITVTDRELESAIREIKRDYPEDVFNELLLKRYIDTKEWKEELKQELLIKKIVSSVVVELAPITFDESKEYYNGHQDEFRHPDMVQICQIVTKSGEEAEMILERLSEGEKMDDLARKYSIAPEGENGGVVGWIAKGEIDKNIEDLVFSLREGEISGILETPYGFHIFKVLSVREAGIKRFPETMAEIDSILTNEKKELFYKEWINKLKDRFPVNIDEKIYDDWNMEDRQ